MISGVGIDIIEVARVAKEIAGAGFKERYFSSEEIGYCESRHGKAGNYAARFAAKEAFFKALGTGYRGGLSFREVEVVNDRLGKPSIVLRGKTKELCRKRKLRGIHVSLTHIKDYASAVVITEG